MNTRKSDWRCVGEDCTNILGEVVGNELEISSNIPGNLIKPRGSNVIITCPVCGARKVWYTSDNLDRAVHQLVEMLAQLISYKIIQKVQENDLKAESGKES